MSALQQSRTSGAYQCNVCKKIDRKERMISHILKYHVRLDQAPFLCTFCLFRCQDKQSLHDHIWKYSRHRVEEARRGLPNYAKVLKRADNPHFVGESDMTQLSREDSIRWFNRKSLVGSPNDEDDDHLIVSGGLSLPRWLVDSSTTVTSVSSTIAKVPIQIPPFSSAMGLKVHQPVYTQSTLHVPTPHIPNGAFRPIAGGNLPPVSGELSSISQTDLSAIHEQSILPVTTTSALNIPSLSLSSPARSDSTPCQDEHDILPGLMAYDSDDSLFDDSDDSLFDETLQGSTPKSQVGEPLYKKAKFDALASTSTVVTTSSIVSTTADRATYQAPNCTSTVLSSSATSAGSLSSTSSSNKTAPHQQIPPTDTGVQGELSRMERKLCLLQRGQAERNTMLEQASSTSASKENEDPASAAILKDKQNKTVKSRLKVVKK